MVAGGAIIMAPRPSMQESSIWASYIGCWPLSSELQLSNASQAIQIQSRGLWWKLSKRHESILKVYVILAHHLADRSSKSCLAHFLITSQFSDHLCINFTKIIRDLGEDIAGDEKLLYYSGASGNVRLVLSKPDKLGLWFYELCSNTEYDEPYILDFKLASSEKELGMGESVADIVERWVNVIQRCQPSQVPILGFDTYYFSKASRDVLVANDIPYAGSVSAGKVQPLVKKLEHHVNQSGRWAALYNEDTEELFVMNWPKGESEKRRQLIVKFLEHDKHHGMNDRYIPGWRLYNDIYSTCDRFNRQIEDRVWPLKHGGHGLEGEQGRQDDFALVCANSNIYTAYGAINKFRLERASYKDFWIQASDDLYVNSFKYG